MDVKQITQVKKTITLSLTGNDIASMLIAAGYLTESQGREQIKFRVPGGGDWSHMDIDIDSTNPVIVSYEVNTTEES